MNRILLLPVLSLLLGMSLTSVIPDSKPPGAAYPGHLSGSFTGGFGEETCRSCHFDYELNPEGGQLTLSGIGDKIRDGERLEIRITLERRDLSAAGFQLSARYADGGQAGSFDIGRSEQIMFSKVVPDSLQFVQHTREGSEPAGNDRQSWSVKWQAPESLPGPVIFNIAANAANGDQSEFGDFIYSEEIKTEY